MPVGCSVPVGVNTAKGDDGCYGGSHQCLSAVRSLLGTAVMAELEWGEGESPMPVGCSVPVGQADQDPAGRLIRIVTNACRLFGPCWGTRNTAKHSTANLVTNACRLFGPCWG